MLGRLVVSLVVLAALAVVAPHVMPGLLAVVMEEPAPDGPAPAVADAPPLAPGYARQATLRADRMGHFAANAVVNGRSTDMLVDTGASIVALTPATARRLGLHPAAGDYSLRMSTANGDAAAAPVMLDEIRIGDVTVRQVPAVVFAGDGLGVDLLGMTFLKRLTRFEVGGGQLLLVQ
jgi:aspartyl protease family protein